MSRIQLNKQVLLIFWAILFALSSPYLGLSKSGLSFQNISKGLSQQNITCFSQDELGFIWVGTSYGLNRFDGSGFDKFEYIPGDPSTLKAGSIEGLLADKKGKVWFGVFGVGLHVYDIHKGEFIHYSSEEKVNNISSIFLDESGMIWLGTDGMGLYLFDPKTEKFTFYNKGKPKGKTVSAKRVSQIVRDNSGNIWLGTVEKGLVKIDGMTGTVSEFNQSNFGIKNNAVKTIFAGQNEKIWVGTKNGLFLFDKEGNLLVPNFLKDNLELFSNLVILSVYESEGALWVGTEDSGLYRIEFSTGIVEQFQNSPFNTKTISGNSIWSIFKDRDNTMWFGTFMSGINKLETGSEKVCFISQISKKWMFWNLKMVSSIAETDGDLWLGFDGEGLMRLNPNFKDFKHFNSEYSANKINDKNVISLLNDSKGNLWVGTWGGGVSLLKKGRDEFLEIYSPENDLSNSCLNNAFSITEDKKGRIWIAGYDNCLELYLQEEDRSIRFSKNIPGRTILSELIRKITSDNSGNIWIGTLGNGLERIKIDENYKIVESEQFFTAKSDAPAYTINDILIDSKNRVWLGTSGEGLICMDRKTNTQVRFSHSIGLPSDLICSMQEDSEGIIWGSTNAGIFSLNPDTKDVQTYLETDESFSNEYFSGSSFKNSEGTIYFGGISGIARIASGQFKSKTKKPELYITGVNISNKPYRPTASDQSKSIFNSQNIVFEHWQNDLSFDFSTINFAGSNPYQVRYKLESFDDEWRLAGTNKNAFYPNLQPGQYKFRIKAFDYTGESKENEVFLNFEIEEPWYLTIGAFMIYALLLISILYLIRKNILSRYRLKNQLQLEHLELEKMQELSEIKEQFFTNISHEFRTPLTLIISPLKTLLERETKPENKELLNIMLQNSAYLQGLTNQILDISRVEAGQEKLRASAGDLTFFLQKTAEVFSQLAKERSIDYQINIPSKSQILFFEKEKIEKVFVNLISNAFKYSPDDGKITVSLREAPTSIFISITNQGEGISEEAREIVFKRFYKGNSNSSSTGIGLALTKHLVEMHHGKISLESENRKGGQTVFTVKLPKGTAHLLPEQIVGPTAPILSDRLVVFSDSTEKTTEKNRIEKDDRPVVLVVEDNDHMRKFLLLLLQEKYVVLEARDGKEGFEKAIEFIPEIIISDVMMPKMNGFELSSKLKKNPLTSHIFIILLTAQATQENIQEGFATGAESYLTKPFEPSVLKLKIQNLLQSRKRFRETIFLNLQPEISPIEEPQILLSKVDEEFMANAIAQIEKRIDDPDFKVEDLAKAVGFSKSQFYRKLKGLIGKSSNEFIRMIRLKRAAELLKTTDFRIAEITYSVGFNDLEYFRTCFKKEYGMSPTKYRKITLEKKTKKV